MQTQTQLRNIPFGMPTKITQILIDAKSEDSSVKAYQVRADTEGDGNKQLIWLADFPDEGSAIAFKAMLDWIISCKKWEHKSITILAAMHHSGLKKHVRMGKYDGQQYQYTIECINETPGGESFEMIIDEQSRIIGRYFYENITEAQQDIDLVQQYGAGVFKEIQKATDL